MKSYLFHTTFLAIVACLLWSSAFAGIKIGLPYITPLQFAGIRFFISGLLILPFTLKWKNYWYFVRNNFSVILTVALLNNLIHYALFYIGLSMVPAALAAIVIGSGPLFIALVAHFYMPDDKLTFKKLAIFLVGFGGIALVSLGRNDFSSVGNISITGVLLLLLVNLISGFGNVIVARDKQNIPPLVFSSSMMIIGGGGLFLISIPIEGWNFGPKPFEFYAALAWLSFLSAAAISIWFTLLKRPGVKVSNLNFWKFLIPVSGAILAWTLLPEEKPGLVAIIGMIIIASALVMLNIYRRRHS